MSDERYRKPRIDGISGRTGGGESTIILVICIAAMISCCVCVGLTCAAAINARQALCRGLDFGIGNSDCRIIRFP